MAESFTVNQDQSRHRTFKPLGVKWTGDNPPQPTFWMHQLRAESGADQKACLNPTVFLSKVGEILKAIREVLPIENIKPNLPEGVRFCPSCGRAVGQAPQAAREARKVVTALFADVVGSTALAERLDPEDFGVWPSPSPSIKTNRVIGPSSHLA